MFEKLLFEKKLFERKLFSKGSTQEPNIDNAKDTFNLRNKDYLLQKIHKNGNGNVYALYDAEIFYLNFLSAKERKNLLDKKLRMFFLLTDAPNRELRNIAKQNSVHSIGVFIEPSANKKAIKLSFGVESRPDGFALLDDMFDIKKIEIWTIREIKRLLGYKPVQESDQSEKALSEKKAKTSSSKPSEYMSE